MSHELTPRDPHVFVGSMAKHFGEEAMAHPLLRPMIVKYAFDLWKAARLSEAEAAELSSMSAEEVLALVDSTNRLEKRAALQDRLHASGQRLLNAMRRLGLEPPPRAAPPATKRSRRQPTEQGTG